MRIILVALFALIPALGHAQGPVDSSGRPFVNATDGSGAFNTIVDSGTLTCNAGSGTFTVGDGSGALNTIVDSGSITANAGTNLNTSALLTTTAHDAAFGTAGTADAQVRTIQGIASMTPVVVSATDLDVRIGGSDSLTIGTLPALVAGTANIGDVDVLTLPALVAGTANIGDVDVLTLPSVTVGTFPDNEPFNMAQKGGATLVAGPCEREITLYISISQTAGTQLVTGTASERIYICSIAIVTATAQNIALVDGTGSVCATSPTGLLGGSTAATGQNFAANGGWVLPYNPYGYAKTSTDADNVCLLQSASGQVSGILTYVSIPNI